MSEYTDGFVKYEHCIWPVRKIILLTFSGKAPLNK